MNIKGKDKRLLAIAIFALIFLLNAALLYANLATNMMISVLYGVNLAVILLLGFTFTNPSYFLEAGGANERLRLSLNHMGAGLLYAVIGVAMACIIIIAAAVPTLDRPLLLLSVAAIFFTYAYAVVVRKD